MALLSKNLFSFIQSLVIIKGEEETGVNDALCGIRITVHILRVITEIEVKLLNGIHNHECSKVFHTDALIQKNVNKLLCRGVIREDSFHRQHTIRNIVSVLFLFFSALSGDFSEEIVDFSCKGIHVVI